MTTKPNPGEFCWNELMTADVEKAKEFYGSLFGWTYQDHHMTNTTYTMFTMGDKMVGGMLPTPSEKMGMIPPHWMSYILVANLAEMLDKAQHLGAQVKVPMTVVEGLGQFAVIADPTGAYISLWEAFAS